MSPLTGVLAEAWDLYRRYAGHFLLIAFVIYLITAVLVALALKAVIGWWWADPAAALIMVPIIAKEGLEPTPEGGLRIGALVLMVWACPLAAADRAGWEAYAQRDFARARSAYLASARGGDPAPGRGGGRPRAVGRPDRHRRHRALREERRRVAGQRHSAAGTRPRDYRLSSARTRRT